MVYLSMAKNTSITTIKLEKSTKSRLDRLKEHEKESYEAVIKKILYILNTIGKSPEKANKILGGIDRNIKNKNIYLRDYSQTKENPKPAPTSNPKQNPRQDKGSR